MVWVCWCRSAFWANDLLGMVVNCSFGLRCPCWGIVHARVIRWHAWAAGSGFAVSGMPVGGGVMRADR